MELLFFFFCDYWWCSYHILTFGVKEDADVMSCLSNSSQRHRAHRGRVKNVKPVSWIKPLLLAAVPSSTRSQLSLQVKQPLLNIRFEDLIGVQCGFLVKETGVFVCIHSKRDWKCFYLVVANDSLTAYCGSVVLSVSLVCFRTLLCQINQSF